MNYLLKFWDGHELVVSEKVGEQIKMAKEKSIGIVKINEAMYETKAISYIEPMRDKGTPTPLLEAPPNPVKKETIERLKKEMAERFGWK